MLALRIGIHFTVVGIAALALASSVRCAKAMNEQSARLLADARQALGGDAALSSIHSFTIKGLVDRGVAGSHGSFEIECELPDKFVRRETTISPGLLPGADNNSPGGGLNETTALGFNGNRLIWEPHWTSRDVLHGTLSPSRPQPLLWEPQADFMRVTLGLFAASFRSAPVEFADAPGTAASIGVTVKGNLGSVPVDGILYFDPLTHRPVRFGDYRYDDYHDVNGVIVPFLVAQTRTGPGTSPVKPAKADDITVWHVREFRANVAIDPKVFKPYATNHR